MNQQFLERVSKKIPNLDIKKDELLKLHTTFKVGGPADFFASPSMNELQILLQLARESDIPVTVIGNGSNLLVGDKGVRGLVIEIGKHMADISVEDTVITAGAGAILGKVAKSALDAGLGGMEFAAGIPGSVGGAVVMNAGAYGGEMKDILISATVLTADGQIKEIAAENLDLSYRHSCVPDKGYVVLEAKYVLVPKDKGEIKAQMDELRDKRLDKQPLEFPSAGSTFKRPEGYFAGKLIMDAGLRGYSVGDAQVSEKHCGFVVNKGNATANDIVTLIKNVQKKVKEEFDVDLETEVKMIGEF